MWVLVVQKWRRRPWGNGCLDPWCKGGNLRVLVVRGTLGQISLWGWTCGGLGSRVIGCRGRQNWKYQGIGFSVFVISHCEIGRFLAPQRKRKWRKRFLVQLYILILELTLPAPTLVMLQCCGGEGLVHSHTAHFLWVTHETLYFADGRHQD